MDKLLVIVGPTGVGKSKYSIELAKQLNGEIISGDAYQIYKAMSIGTAKITKEEMQGIPHYLVDELNFDHPYSVADFQRLARKHIETIISKGKLPIICGGTGLYIKAVLYDYVFEKEEVDEEYKAQLKNYSNEELYEQLRIIDAKSLETIHINNRQRVERALMIAHSGKLKSDIVDEQQHKLLYDATIIGLTLPREQLYDKINQRVNTMMETGLLSEIEQLLNTANKTNIEEVWNLQAMKGIGYKEWKNYFDKVATKEETIALIQKNSRNFAKRQYTWFNNQLEVNWINVTTKEETLKRALEIFKK
ncbi:MAG: tRNA (adenosine(37)-N6)-dimethylallyltransferase MiaA [Erysipelotrichaceae bacterium]